MERCEHGDSASLYALGLPDEAESSGFEQHLIWCPVCAAEVRQSSDLAVQLAETIPASAPPRAFVSVSSLTPCFRAVWSRWFVASR
jgi:hypothetical protein